MRPFETYFDFAAVLRCLISIEVKRRVSRGGYAPDDGRALSIHSLHHHQLRQMLPPRRQWLRPNRSQRRLHSAIQCQSICIYDAVMQRRRQGSLEEPVWGKELLRFAERIEKRAVALDCTNVGNVRHTVVPRVRLVTCSLRCFEPRPISYFDALEDRVFWSLANTFLSAMLDSAFYPNVHAFRSSNHKSFNTAVDAVIQFCRRSRGTMFTAQLDIRKLYDTISHDIVLASFDELVARNPCLHAVNIPHARTLILNYLALCKENTHTHVTPSQSSGWQRLDARLRTKLAALHEQPLPPIGLLTGGSPSSTLANLVLNVVDHFVLSRGIPRLLYVRYADNVFLAHTERSACERAQMLLLHGLSQVKLLPHAPVEWINPSFSFFSAKSINVHPWGHGLRECQWVSFLGYQIRWDGFLRISLESVCSAQESIGRLQRGLIRSLLYIPRPKVTRLKIRGVLLFHLLGKAPFHILCSNMSMHWSKYTKKELYKLIPYWTLRRERREISWRAAFVLLSIYTCDRSRMKSLDRYLERMVSHTSRTLAYAGRIEDAHVDWNLNTGGEWTRLFNYYQAFRRRPGQGLKIPRFRNRDEARLPEVTLRTRSAIPLRDLS